MKLQYVIQKFVKCTDRSEDKDEKDVAAWNTLQVHTQIKAEHTVTTMPSLVPCSLSHLQCTTGLTMVPRAVCATLDSLSTHVSK